MVRTLNPEKKANLLSAALKLFVLNGVKNTSTAEIAREAGLAAGTLFLYFPTKQALLDELVLKVGREQSEYINSLLSPSQSARESFFAIWSGTVHWFLENMPAYQYIQQVRDTGMISQGAVQESAKSLSYYFAAIQKGLAEGCLKSYPVDLIGGFLYQDLVATMTYLSMQADPGKQEESILQGFEIFWDGIKVPSENGCSD